MLHVYEIRMSVVILPRYFIWHDVHFCVCCATTNCEMHPPISEKHSLCCATIEFFFYINIFTILFACLQGRINHTDIVQIDLPTLRIKHVTLFYSWEMNPWGVSFVYPWGDVYLCRILIMYIQKPIELYLVDLPRCLHTVYKWNIKINIVPK